MNIDVIYYIFVYGNMIEYVYIDVLCNEDIWTKMDLDCVPVEMRCCAL